MNLVNRGSALQSKAAEHVPRTMSYRNVAWLRGPPFPDVPFEELGSRTPGFSWLLSGCKIACASSPFP